MDTTTLGSLTISRLGLGTLLMGDTTAPEAKVRFPVSDPGGEGLSAERVRDACDASLRRLGVETIDLYQLHAPDPDVPLEEALEVLDGLVRAGKVRAVGASNFPAWLLAWAAEHGATVPQVAIAWLLGAEGIAAPLVGPRTLEQLEGLLGAVALRLSREDRARLEAHAQPPEAYPQRMLAEQAGTPDLRGARRRPAVVAR